MPKRPLDDDSDAELECWVSIGRKKKYPKRVSDVLRVNASKRMSKDDLPDEKPLPLAERHAFPFERGHEGPKLVLDRRNGEHNYYVEVAPGVWARDETLTKSVSGLASAEKAPFNPDMVSRMSVKSRWAKAVAALELKGVDRQSAEKLLAAIVAAQPKEAPFDEDAEYDHAGDEQIEEIAATDPQDVWELAESKPHVFRMFDPTWHQTKWRRTAWRGTAAHREVERFYNGLPVSEAFAKTHYGKLFLEFARNPEYGVDRVLRTELAVFYDELGIFGQIDAVFRVPGRDDLVDIVDWKFVENMTPAKLKGYEVQLMLYKELLEACAPEITVRRLQLVNFPPDPKKRTLIHNAKYDPARILEVHEKRFASLWGEDVCEDVEEAVT